MSPRTSARTPGSPLGSRPFIALLAASVGLFFGFSLLVSVVPLWVVERGSGEFAAGAATGVFMATTVLAQFLMAGLVPRFGYRAMSIVGALALSVPAPLLMISTTWQPVLVIAAARGLGFGIVTVCGSALVAELLPRRSHGRGTGAYGVAVGLPLLVGLPASTWIAQQVSFTLVFVLGAVAPALAILPLVGLPGHERAAVAPAEGSWTSMAAIVWRPWLAMLCGSVAFGAMVTFLPLVFIDVPVAGSVALLLMSATALGSRWLAGVMRDRSAVAGRVLLAGLAMTGAGLLGFGVGTGLPGTTAMVLGIACVALYGTGFGAVQNDSLVLMFTRTTAARASVAWNVAFDTGQGLGAVAVGALVSATSYAVAFGCLGGVALALVPAMLRETR